jgi:hypothetical protein
MNRHGLPHASWMCLICALPLVIVFVLVLTGVPIHPLLVPLILVLCCLAMFFLMSGSCAEHMEHASDKLAEDEIAPSFPEVKTEDVFRVEHSRYMGGTLVLEGELLRPADDAYEILKKRFEAVGVAALLQEGDNGRPLLVLVPEAAVRAERGGKGP